MPIPFNSIDVGIIKHIFSFLNVKDLCIITQVSSYWKKIIEQKDTFKIVNLTVLSDKVNTLNLMKFISKNIEKLYLPLNASKTDTTYLLMCIPKGLKFLQINNINMEFANIFFNLVFEELETLQMNNVTNRKKLFDDIEIKEFHQSLPNLKELFIDSVPLRDSTIKQLFPNPFQSQNLGYEVRFTQNLKKLSLLNCPHLTNQTLSTIALNFEQLEHLELGGTPTNYNQDFSIEELLVEKFNTKLKEIAIIRNCFEKTAKISDEGLKYLKRTKNLERLNITYSRKFREFFHIHIAMNLKNLKYLCIRECPVQEDLGILSSGCPNLEELDMSGDSWVTSSCLLGVSKHPNLKIYHLGHFDHGDSQCDENLQEHPPKGMFLEGVFKDKSNFKKLHLIYLEQSCSLTYWIDMRLQSIRPHLTIKYTPQENLFELKEQ
ncbi:F-box domain [Pseudocohnilembus persalinus]|uniref:F-box domain n=1 Tax=Pseudocohnilembus persalinus TaxID=266149 RepID=A0A0V0QUX4_PSEPJ|nr:F-box domain [Pseudocohnilembus persalinus]|eukprot:KRX05752.1 F-box domain [Pseudocohnilembus persalinus]